MENELEREEKEMRDKRDGKRGKDKKRGKVGERRMEKEERTERKQGRIAKRDSGGKYFLDAFTHLFKRFCPPILRPSVGPSAFRNTFL